MAKPVRPVFRIENADRISGAALAAFGIAAFFGAGDLEFGSLLRPGTGFFPLLLSAMIALLGAVIAIRSPEDENATVARFYGSYLQIGFVIVAVALYAVVLEPAGFLLCTSVLMIVLLKFLGQLDWRRSLSAAAISTAAVYFLFQYLGVPLPVGWLFQ